MVPGDSVGGDVVPGGGVRGGAVTGGGVITGGGAVGGIVTLALGEQEAEKPLRVTIPSEVILIVREGAVLV